MMGYLKYIAQCAMIGLMALICMLVAVPTANANGMRQPRLQININSNRQMRQPRIQINRFVQQPSQIVVQRFVAPQAFIMPQQYVAPQVLQFSAPQAYVMPQAFAAPCPLTVVPGQSLILAY